MFTKCNYELNSEIGALGVHGTMASVEIDIRDGDPSEIVQWTSQEVECPYAHGFECTHLCGHSNVLWSWDVCVHLGASPSCVDNGVSQTVQVLPLFS